MMVRCSEPKVRYTKRAVLSRGWFAIKYFWFDLVSRILYIEDRSTKGVMISMSETLGKRIKRFRLEAGLTLPDLADKSQITKWYIWQLEEGKTQNPSLEILSRIAAALDKTIAEITRGEAIIKPVKGKAIEIPPSLAEFIEEQKQSDEPLTDADVEMLARVQYRGNRPSTKQDWLTLYSVIRSVSKRSRAKLKATKKK